MARLTRDQVLSRLDIESFYKAQFESLGIPIGRHGSELAARCPFHDDNNPSFTVNPETGVFMCHAGSCGATGSPFDFIMKNQNVSFPEAFKRVKEFAGIREAEAEPPALSDDIVHSAHQRLVGSAERVQWLRERRGLTDETIRQYELGWDGLRYWIPIRDEHGKLRNIRKYKPDAKRAHDKMISHAVGDGKDKIGYGKMRIYPMPLPPEFVLICEGELDALIARQEGFPAITATTGAGHFNQKWAPLFKDRDVVIAYDHDEAGRVGADTVAGHLVDVAKSVRILRWPADSENKLDVTDWFVKLGNSSEQFQQLIDEAQPYTPPAPEPEVPVSDVALSQAAQAKYSGKPVRMRFMVSGKDTEPFIVPKKVKIKCDQENGAACLTCGMSRKYKGEGTAEFTDKDRETLGLINCSESQQKGYIARKFGIVARCQRYRIEVLESQNIQDVTVIPEMNGNLLHSEQGHYVTRTMYAMTSEIQTNRVYNAQGYTHPDVTQQRATCLLGQLDPVEVSIDHFELTPERIERLKVFQPTKGQSVLQKMQWIAGEMEKVHHIRGRTLTQIAYDLCWHSVLMFDCFGELEEKGWVEVFMIGDSGQGKSEIAKKLLQFYQTGQRIDSEQASAAGLIGGLEKRRDRFEIQWGAIVLNSGRLLVIDEVHGLKEEVAEALTDIRSTGRVQIIKIHKEEAYARTRLIMIGNPKSGLTLSTYEHGVEAIYPGTFRKPEDVRRIDIALAAASGEVDLDSINQTYHDVEAPIFTGDDCYDLVMWAWSRKRNHVRVHRDTEDMLLAHAKHLATKYSSRIPLVEGADIRKKLARVAVAAAARQFSTEDGVHLDVTFEHADFAGKFLDSCYSSHAFGYDRFSARHLGAERFVQNNEGEIIQRLKSITRTPADLVELLLNERYIVQKDIEAQAGLTREEVKKLISMLTKMRCLERVTSGFRKKPAFIALLRKIEKEHLEEWRREGDPLGLTAEGSGQ